MLNTNDAPLSTVLLPRRWGGAGKAVHHLQQGGHSHGLKTWLPHKRGFLLEPPSCVSILAKFCSTKHFLNKKVFSWHLKHLKGQVFEPPLELGSLPQEPKATHHKRMETPQTRLLLFTVAEKYLVDVHRTSLKARVC